MSRLEDKVNDSPERAALKRLDGAVQSALGQVKELTDRARTAEARSRELEALLDRFSRGGENPGAYMERLRALEEENGDLQGRLANGRETAERLLAKVRFLEEQK